MLHSSFITSAAVPYRAAGEADSFYSGQQVRFSVAPVLENTQIGTEGKQQNQSDDVARQAIDALLAGNDHIDAAASAKTKLEG